MGERGRDPRDEARRLTAAPKFKLGQVVGTPNALASLNQNDIQECLGRHHRGDWGEVCEEDRKANDLALRDGSRLLSAYTDREGVKFWILTEGDRSATTVLLPEDY